jgi:hypothetical protein
MIFHSIFPSGVYFLCCSPFRVRHLGKGAVRYYDQHPVPDAEGYESHALAAHCRVDNTLIETSQEGV